MAQNNIIGKLSETWITSGSTMLAGTVFGYDSMGRVLANNQCTPQNCGSANLAVNYTYDLAGDMTSATNMSGGTVSYGYDAAARVNSVSLSGSSLVSNRTYNANSLPVTTSYGNGLTEAIAYKALWQPCRINTNSSGATPGCSDAVPSGNVLDMNYGYNVGTADNGNLITVDATGQQTLTRSYSYDSLNRLATFSDAASGATCTGLSWTYDAWGNRTAQTMTGGTCLHDSFTVSTNNQLGSPYTYDAAGNVAYDGNHHYFYDAENRLIQADGTLGTCTHAAGTNSCYAYDANGLRVEKDETPLGYQKADYVHDLSGHSIGDFWFSGGSIHWDASEVYLGSHMLAALSGGSTFYASVDASGSTRLITDSSKAVQECDDYYPYCQTIMFSSFQVALCPNCDQRSQRSSTNPTFSTLVLSLSVRSVSL